MAEYTNVGKLADFPTGEIKAVRVDEKSVAVVQVGGRVHAYANYCPHAGYTLSGGFATESRVICDVHGAHFDIDPFRKYCLLNGLDDIGLTLRHEAELDKYESKHDAEFWLEPRSTEAA